MALFSRKNKGPVTKVTRFDMHWDTEDPFLFVSHHEDDYPHGNRQLAPPLAEITGRDLGRDFEKRLGFRMYNGKVVPGFPMHAHWGYETVTLPEIGYVDHYDIMRNEGRFGFGDVQWVMASSKYMHNEMYPLINQEDRNPNDITQIMINLPLEAKNKENGVATIWSPDVPVVEGDGCSVKVLCGVFGDADVRSPFGDSWANGEHAVRILMISMSPGSSVTIDATTSKANRNVYMISGSSLDVCGTSIEPFMRAKVSPDMDMTLTNGDSGSVVWVLEGEPIGQKMASFGPVTLKDEKEVRAALEDIRKNEFKEWPYDVIDKVHPQDSGRFLRYPDGTESRPPE
ncbi:MAG: pirin family protein [Candidatus Methanomethylophilaceae archaeon]|nr:pirin family protein [Candidatus Methanomethylophilaceae archaeon]